MEIKVLCPCGQKFAFDVDPVNGQMPFVVTCPCCDADGTAAANELIAAHFTAAPRPAPLTSGRMRVNLPAPEPER